MARASLAAALRRRLPLGRRDEQARELMDDPDCEVRTLLRTYAAFSIVNAVVSGTRSLYVRHIRPRAAGGRQLSLLDVGCGGADMPRRLAAWAREDGIELRIVGIDPDERAIAFARAQNTRGIELRQTTTTELCDSDEQFDVVVSNHLLHHLTDPELGALLAESEHLTAPGGIAIHGDIERSLVAYAGFALGTLPFARGLLRDTFIQADGLTSIRRSWTARELRAVIPPPWQVRRAVPSRLELWAARP